MSLRPNTLALGVMLTISASSPSGQSPVLKLAMREKLANMEALLGPVVQGDYAAIARYTEPLSRITEAEIASWQAVAEPEYVQQATLFLLSVEGLREAASTKNIEAVTLEYTTLISSCIRCHTYIRSSRRAAREPVPPNRIDESSRLLRRGTLAPAA